MEIIAVYAIGSYRSLNLKNAMDRGTEETANIENSKFGNWIIRYRDWKAG